MEENTPSTQQTAEYVVATEDQDDGYDANAASSSASSCDSSSPLRVETPSPRSKRNPHACKPCKDIRKADKFKCAHCTFLKEMRRYMPRRACGRCEECKKPTCGVCKNCVYNAGLTAKQLASSKKRCVVLSCTRMKRLGPEPPGNMKSNDEFKRTLMLLNGFEIMRKKYANLVKTRYCSTPKCLFARRMLRCIEECSRATFLEFSDVLLVNEDIKHMLHKHPPYYLLQRDVESLVKIVEPQTAAVSIERKRVSEPKRNVKRQKGKPSRTTVKEDDDDESVNKATVSVKPDM